MLKRDLLVTLHLRVRVVATPELKHRVRIERDLAKARKTRMRERSLSRGRGINVQDVPVPEEEGSPTWFSLSPKAARRKTRRMSSQSSSRSRISGMVGSVIAEDEDIEDEDYGSSDADDGSEAASDTWPSMIGDPGRATPKERRWLTAMSEGKDPYIVKRFELCVLIPRFLCALLLIQGVNCAALELTSSLMASARMTRFCIRRIFPGSNCGRFCTIMMTM